MSFSWGSIMRDGRFQLGQIEKKNVLETSRSFLKSFYYFFSWEFLAVFHYRNMAEWFSSLAFYSGSYLALWLTSISLKCSNQIEETEIKNIEWDWELTYVPDQEYGRTWTKSLPGNEEYEDRELAGLTF